MIRNLPTSQSPARRAYDNSPGSGCRPFATVYGNLQRAAARRARSTSVATPNRPPRATRIRSATSSGCSTTLVAWVTTPGMRILPWGSLTCREPPLRAKNDLMCTATGFQWWNGWLQLAAADSIHV